MHKWKYGTIIFFLCLVLTAVVLLVYWNLKYHQIENLVKSKEEYLRGLVNKVNSNPTSSWKAKYNKFGETVRTYEFQSFPRDFSWVKKYYHEVKEYSESEGMKRHIRELQELIKNPLPTHFDAREKWPHCPSLHYIPNQGGCGSCYAVAAVSVASDRLCIHSNGSFRSILSVQDALTCCENCGGCFGGDPLKVLSYFVKDGLVTGISPPKYSYFSIFGGRDGCKPYEFDLKCGVPCSPSTYQVNEATRRCEKRCQNIYYQREYKEDKFHGGFAYSLAKRRFTLINNNNEHVVVPTVFHAMNQSTPMNDSMILTVLKHEIMTYGPITLTFPVTEEFLHYSEGVFRPFPKEEMDTRIIYWHVVRLIGWGRETDGSHYWLAVNSFGNHWGDVGHFRMNIELLQAYGLEYEAVL